jgi:signal transduction histidine kinase
MLQTAFLAMGEIGVVLAIFVAIPAVPVAIITGFRRARSISEPVEQLATVASRVANGDLSARVEVTGEDEIARLESEFNQMADQLGDALKEETTHRARAEWLLAANRSLISNVSHELRTPVAVVRSHLEALLAEPAQGEEYARIALRETDRLERLVEDLFQLTRLESKGLQITTEPMDAAAAIREAFESLAEPARREAGITMICEAPDKPLMALADHARIVQVLQNLIRNAIRHTPEGGIILVSAEREPDGDIALQVLDTGEGIPREHLPRIFERFYRADPSRTHSGGGGAGLGLAIAKELITAMGGTIAVESEPGEGAAFTIRLRPVDAE